MSSKKTKAVSLIITIIVSSVVFITVLLTLSKSIVYGTNYDYINNLYARCVPFQTIAGDKKVILRLDDIQSYIYTQSIEEIVSDTLRRKFKMVLGVIPAVTGQDIRISELLRMNNCNMEIALHGWDHGIPDPQIVPYEFENISENDAYIRLQKGLTVLKRYSRNPIFTFIPPGNVLSDGALQALAKINIGYVSDGNNGPNHIIQSTYDFEKNRMIPTQEIMQNCDKAFSDKKACVIIIHPQDYMTNGRLDWQKYAEYKRLLDALSNEGVQTITFREIGEPKFSYSAPQPSVAPSPTPSPTPTPLSTPNQK